jgi:hypothetical protein
VESLRFVDGPRDRDLGGAYSPEGRSMADIVPPRIRKNLQLAPGPIADLGGDLSRGQARWFQRRPGPSGEAELELVVADPHSHSTAIRFTTYALPGRR